MDPAKAAQVEKLLATMKSQDALLAAERFAPSSQAVRLRFTKGKPNPAMTDGPFAESKELVGGFVIVDVPTREEAVRLSIPYGNALGDLELEGSPELRDDDADCVRPPAHGAGAGVGAVTQRVDRHGDPLTHLRRNAVRVPHDLGDRRHRDLSRTGHVLKGGPPSEGAR